MKVVENGTSDEITNMAEKCIDKKTSIRSDKAKSYPKEFENFNNLQMFDMSKFDAGKVIPWSKYSNYKLQKLNRSNASWS